MKFEEIYIKNKRLVYNLALHYVQNCQDAEEITQDVFVAVYKALGKFRGESGLATWLYRITINKCLDFIKARRRKKRFAILTSLFLEGGTMSKYQPHEFNHPGVQLEDKEGLKMIFNHINLLPNNQKTALILTKIEQKSQIEAAQIMNLSPKAIESLIQRAKNTLSKKLNCERRIINLIASNA